MDNFNQIYAHVSKQAVPVSATDVSAILQISLAEVEAALAEPAAFSPVDVDGNTHFVANPSYVQPSEPVRVAVDSLSELFPDPETPMPETDELADFLANYSLSDAVLSDLEYTTRQTGHELSELAAKYGVDANNAGFALVRQKLAVAAALIHNLRIQGM